MAPRVTNDDDQRRESTPVMWAGDDAPSTSDREIAIAIDLLPVAALIYDRDDGTVRHANPLFESLAGVTNDEFAGHQISDFYRDSVEHDDFISQLLREGVVSGRQVTGTLADGNEIWLDTSSRWVVYGDRPAVLTLFTDIDAEKSAQLASEIEHLRSSAYAEISAIIARGRPGEEVFEKVADVVVRLVPFDRMGIALLNDDSSKFTLVFAQGTAVKGWEDGTSHETGDSLIWFVTQTRAGLIVDPDQTDELPVKYPALASTLDAGLKSLLIVPMIADGRVVGTISLRSLSSRNYSRSELAIIERVASLLAPALEQARLYTGLEQEAREREIIAEIGRVISASPDMDKVTDRFAELVRTLIPSDLLTVTVLTDNPESFRNILYSGDPVPGFGVGETNDSSGSIIEAATKDPQLVLLHPRNRAAAVDAFRTLGQVWDAGLRSFLSLPLITDDRVVGVLHLRSRTPNAYNAHHVLLAESVAAQASGVIAISMLHAIERRDAETNAGLAEIGRIITSATDVRPVFERFGQLVGKILPFSRLVVTLIDLDSGTATDTYVYGKKIPGWKEGTVHEIAGTPFEKVLRTRRILYMPDISEELPDAPIRRKALTDAGLHSSLMAPLWSNGELIGCLNFTHSEARAYTPRYIELAERIADQIAGAIANARLYEDLQLVADERRALASIALAATRSLDLDGVFARAADSLTEVMDYERMSITLLDQEDRVLRVAFTRGQPLDGFRAGDAVAPVEGDPFDGESWTWEGGLVFGSRQDGRLRGMVQAPLGNQTRLLGYIRLRSRAADAYDYRSVDMLGRVATYLTPAIQNALEHDREKRLALERERSLVLDHKNRELRRLSEAKSQFLTTVTHELKTPLTSITAFTNILLKNRRGGMTEKDLSQLVVIQRNNRRLKNLIDDLLDLSQIDQGGLSLTLTEFYADDMLTEVLDGFRPISDAKSQKIVSSPPRRPVSIRADRDRLGQVMTNLLSNASKYSPKGETITVSTRRWKDRLYFSVTDHGIGISEENRRSLFTPFFRVDNEETRAVPGTGIGLYISKTLVDLHDGKIEVKASPGGGTTVSFYIPGACSGVVNAGRRQETMARVIPWSRMVESPEAPEVPEVPGAPEEQEEEVG